jgi:hypothetical protein
MPAPQLNTYFQTFKTDDLGQIFLTGILNVETYSKVNLDIIQWPHVAVSMTVSCDMGKLSGATLAQTVGQFALGTATQIHTFDVVGPEFSVILTGGPPNTDVPIQAWVFLSTTDVSARSPCLFAVDYGVKADGVELLDGQTTAGSTTLTSALASWTTSDNGKICVVQGAGVNGAALPCTITIVDAHTAKMSVAASVSSAPIKHTDGAITEGTNLFTSASMSLVAGDINKIISIAGSSVFPKGPPQILSINSPTSANLGFCAATTVSGASFTYGGGAAGTMGGFRVNYGTDDTSNIVAMMNAAGSGAGPSVCQLDPGISMITGLKSNHIGITVNGYGQGGQNQQCYSMWCLAAESPYALATVGSVECTYNNMWIEGNNLASLGTLQMIPLTARQLFSKILLSGAQPHVGSLTYIAGDSEVDNIYFRQFSLWQDPRWSGTTARALAAIKVMNVQAFNIDYDYGSIFDCNYAGYYVNGSSNLRHVQVFQQQNAMFYYEACQQFELVDIYTERNDGFGGTTPNLSGCSNVPFTVEGTATRSNGGQVINVSQCMVNATNPIEFHGKQPYVLVSNRIGGNIKLSKVAPPGPGTGTVALTRGSATITFSAAQTLAIGTTLSFASQPGIIYTLGSSVSSSTSGTLTEPFSGPVSVAATTWGGPAISIFKMVSIGTVFPTPGIGFVGDLTMVDQFTTPGRQAVDVGHGQYYTTTNGSSITTSAAGLATGAIGLVVNGQESHHTTQLDPLTYLQSTDFGGTAQVINWYDAMSGIVLDGSGNVQQWNDQTAFLHNLTQPTAGNRPGYVALGGAGDKGYVNIATSGNDALSAPITSSTANPFEVFAVLRDNGGTGSQLLDTNGAGQGIRTGGNGIAMNGTVFGPSIAEPGGTGVDYLLDCEFNNGSSGISVNGGTAVIGNNGTIFYTSFITVGNVHAGGASWVGRVYLIYIVNAALSSTYRAQVQAQLCHNFGLRFAGAATGMAYICDTMLDASNNIVPDRVVVSNSACGLAVTLPPPTIGRVITFVDNVGLASTVASIVVLPNGGEKINSTTSATMSTNWGQMTVRSPDGINWIASQG